MGCTQACACLRDTTLGSSLCCFSLCILSVILTPGKEELRPLQERGEARLYEGDWLPICHLCREEEVWEKGEGKGETGVALCPRPSTLGVHLGGWKLGPEA